MVIANVNGRDLIYAATRERVEESLRAIRVYAAMAGHGQPVVTVREVKCLACNDDGCRRCATAPTI